MVVIHMVARRLALVGIPIVLAVGVAAAVLALPGRGPATTPGPVMPSLTGRRRADAEAAVRAAGFIPSTMAVAPNAVCGGDAVIAQSPAPGSPVGPGATVGYAICPPATVPHLIGKPESAARQALAAAGFVPSVAPPETVNCTRGRVAGQVPAAGATVARRTTVVYAMCAGP